MPRWVTVLCVTRVTAPKHPTHTKVGSEEVRPALNEGHALKIREPVKIPDFVPLALTMLSLDLTSVSETSAPHALASCLKCFFVLTTGLLATSMDSFGQTGSFTYKTSGKG